MFKKKGLVILTLVLLILLAGNFNVNAYHPHDQDTIMIYFYRIGVIEDWEMDPLTELEWEDFEEIFTAALPGHEFNEELVTSTYLDNAQLIAQIINAVDQEEFIYTFSDNLNREQKILATADILELNFYHDGPRPVLVDALNMLLKARIDLGLYIPYLGHINDYDIYQVSRLKRESINKDDFQNAVPELFEVGVKGLDTIPGGTFTGYNIKDYNENPLFDPEFKIRYDHGNMGHLLQMISLLRRDNFYVDWDVKGRISSYVHHIDQWGEPSPESVIAEIDDTRVVVGSASYDILIEFPNMSQMERFKVLVDDFARRKQEDTTGLIRSPYYAPVYGTITSLPGYEEVIGVRVNHGHYYLQSYVLVEYAEQVVEELERITEELAGDFTIETETYYVNPEFVNYLRDNLTD